MSSGVEVLVFLPFLLAGGSTGGAAAGTVTASAAAGSAISGAIGAPVITTGAVSAGSAGAVGAGASGAAGTGALAGAASLASGAIVVAGAAGVALLAAYGMSKGYEAALCAHRTRIEAQQAGFRVAQQQGQTAAHSALSQVRKSQVKASESAELAFLQAGVKRLRHRLGNWPDVDPRLPDGCVYLERELATPAPDLKALFVSYEALAGAVANEAAKQRARLVQAATSTSATAAQQEALRAANKVEIESLRQDVESAPAEVLAAATRAQLQQMLTQVEHLTTAQPHMAQQGLQMLRGRINRALLEGSEQAARRRADQERTATELRELSAHISARCQAVLSALEPAEFRSNTSIHSQAQLLQTSALAQLQKLATLLGSELPSNLAPLQRLAQESDALFDSTQKQLESFATQIYLQEQVADVFTQLGYRVTLNESQTSQSTADYTSESPHVLATLDTGHGVEVSWDGQGNLHSELVAFSSNSTDVEPAIQEKACALMDEVFDALKARGCGVREKKRRHYRKGEHRLRVVATPTKKADAPASAITPTVRRLGE